MSLWLSKLHLWVFLLHPEVGQERELEEEQIPGGGSVRGREAPKE